MDSMTTSFKQTTSYDFMYVVFVTIISLLALTIIVILIVIAIIFGIKYRAKLKAIEVQQLEAPVCLDTYENAGRKPEIDPAVEADLEEQLKKLSKMPDILQFTLYSEEEKSVISNTRKNASMMNLNSIYSNGLAKPDSPLLRRHVDDVKNGEKAKRRGSDPKLYSSFNFPDLPKANSILTYNDLKGIPIHVSDLKSYYYVNTLKSQKDQFMDVNKLCKQYRNIQNNTGASSEVSSIQVNKAKNRYIDIRPYDHSRVILQPLKGVENSDYINASFINGYNMRTSAYIASQAPKANTVVDMWRMIWQERCSIIIMIANVIENGRQKCERYWPKTLNEKFGDIEVITTAAEGFAFYIQRKFMLRKGKESRTVLHVQFTGWLDHGVPNSKLDLLNFY